MGHLWLLYTYPPPELATSEIKPRVNTHYLLATTYLCMYYLLLVNLMHILSSIWLHAQMTIYGLNYVANDLSHIYALSDLWFPISVTP